MLPLRTILPILLAFTAASPALAQIDLTLRGSDGGSTATVTTQQTLPHFDGPFINAVAASGVNIRSAPTSHGSTVIGTLHEGDRLSVRCAFGWCELAGNAGYTAEKFLSLEGGGFAPDDSTTFDSGGGFGAGAVDDGTGANFDANAGFVDGGTVGPGDDSFGAIQPPAAGVSTGDAPPVRGLTPVNSASVAGNFDGLWTVLDASGKPGMPLILKQTDKSVTGTLQNPGRLAKITGDISGTKLNFTYDMLNEKGKTIASGSGFFSLGKGGATLSGVLMLNGLVVSNVSATR